MTRARFWRTALALLLTTSPVWAVPRSPAPDYGVVQAVAASGVVDLELHRPDMIRQPEFRGYSREFLKMPESHSSRRFPQGQPLTWTVCNRTELPDNCGVNWIMLHPSGFELHPLKVENSARILMLVEANPYQETEHSGLPLKVRQVDEDHLRLECGTALTPGEYALVYQPRDGRATVFCFGIDAVSP